MSEYEREADKLRERKLKEDIKVRRQRIEKERVGRNRRWTSIERRREREREIISLKERQ